MSGCCCAQGATASGSAPDAHPSTKGGMAEVPELSSLPDKKQVAVFEALRKMQAEHDRIIAEMNEAKRQLAVRARALVEPLWDARMALISGAASTADAEGAALAAKSSSLSGFTFQPEAEGEKAAAKSEEGEASESAAASASGDGSSGDAVTARFTEFWTQVLVNDPIWADMIESRDMPALEFLIDCRVSTHADWKGFTLEWTFADNPYFTNKVLSKQVRVSLLSTLARAGADARLDHALQACCSLVALEPFPHRSSRARLAARRSWG